MLAQLNTELKNKFLQILFPMSLNKAFIDTLIRPEILAMSAYQVATASGFIKLDAMENPYAWPTDLTQLWLQSLRDCPINRYPEPNANALVAKLQQVHRIPKHCTLLLGNGSDEIIQILLMALPSRARVLAPNPSFIMYQQISQSLGLQYHSVKLQSDNFALDISSMLQAIKKWQPTIIFLAYPNNPTGNIFNTEEMHQIIRLAPGIVVIDEAYASFTNSSFIDELNQHSNLLIMRTLSKLGLAGLRLGYIAGDPKIITQLHKIKLPYNINVLTQASALFALEHNDIFCKQSASICANREQMSNSLSTFTDLKSYPSQANFILFKTLKHNADNVFQSLKEQKVLIKNLSPQGHALTNCLRVTIGKTKENKIFLHALKRALK